MAAGLARYKILHQGSRQILDFILPGQVFGPQEKGTCSLVKTAQK